MRASPVISLSWRERRPLPLGWTLLRTAPGAARDPEAVEAIGGNWMPAEVPGTVASALRSAGDLDLDHPPDLDGQDAWYRFVCPEDLSGGPQVLELAGVATGAELWVDGRPLPSTDSMFRSHRVPLPGGLRAGSVLHLRFPALAARLAERRPRPRWKTRLVSHQQLRWWRTTLLGRIPAWTPPVPPVGPYRGVVVEAAQGPELVDATVEPGLDQGTARLSVSVRLRSTARPGRGRLVLGEVHGEAEWHSGPAGCFDWSTTLEAPGLSPWWPHTHGRPALYPLRLELEGVGTIAFHRVGFRTLEVDETDGGFTLRCNGTPIFCRGACWTPLDVVSLQNDPPALERALLQVRDAGMNMLRVGGTMVYEEDAFHDACDALGILIWQDLMFANMDYPVEDPAFVSSVEAEVDEVVGRIGARPSTAIFCGNSEVEQQAAMLGLEPALWRSRLFSDVIPARIARRSPAAYVPSSPSGGVLPFQPGTGVAHYYGVGAYLRPLEDARRADVRFTSECLAFSNVPDIRTVESLLADGEVPPHHPRWKARVPRDRGTGWDFEDVREFYTRLLFGLDPVAMRWAAPERALAFGRLTTAEVMASAISEWRRHGSRCAGALVWFLRDLWPGAGWGVIDSTGLPKAAYWGLRRVFSSHALLLTDEGTNGLALHLVNEGAEPVRGTVRLVLYRNHEHPVATGSSEVEVPARGTLQLWAEGLLGRFVDVGHAFRFGPPNH
ncbi:MAG TPA: hypothetical protein VGG91_19760, partial [Myxococcaceae bacterium]